MKTPPDLTRTRIPFMLYGLDGEVLVEFGVNKDPARWGYDLFGERFPPESARGFPVVQASVTYAGEGYRADMGWVQIVRYRIHDTSEAHIIFDAPPKLRDTETPYFAFGVRPTLFDAPSIGRNHDVTWDADAFLVHSPDAVLSRVMHAICGFTWGYRVRDATVHPVEPTVAVESDWERNLADLRSRYGTWEFGSSWSSAN